ncbi:MAG TPA: PIG-L family deacetylase [Acidobacteriota bacterium]|jgi:LmbE family N-acetylglucosaminyl deacetylase|nr:PIG-L family deacetylase [Acidobacteriota bacterium]
MDENQPGRRALAIMAHPDDVEILVGGSLFHLRTKGWELGIVTMTAGDCGSSTLSSEEIARVRYGEAKAAAEYLGAWYRCAGLRDIEVILNAQSIRVVVELLRQFRPQVVITHSPTDYMLDHEETSRIVRAATFSMAMPLYHTRQVPPAEPARATPALYYADPVEGINLMGERVHPQFYVDVTATMDDKLRMLSFHSSQREWLRQHHGLDEYLIRTRQWAEQYGEECGANYAEGFRQHLGHGYPRQPILQDALKDWVRLKDVTEGEVRYTKP